MFPLRPAFVMVAAMVLAGCGSGQPGSGDDDAAARDDLDRLLALPYLGSSPAGKDDRSGLVRFDAGRSFPGYSLYTVQMLCRADLIDHRGSRVRSWTHGNCNRWERADLLDDGDLFVIGSDAPDEPVDGIPDDSRYLLRLDWDGSVIWKRPLLAHHDVDRNPRGDLVVLTLQRLRIPEVHPELDTRDDLITVLDETGNEVESRSLLKAFSGRPDVFRFGPPRANSMGVRPWIDVFHANSLEWIDRPDLRGRHPIFEPDHVLLCMRNQNRIAVVDWNAWRVVWSWGEDELRGPHDAQVLDNGNLLVFDNGVGRGWSRVIELDPVTESIVWEYRAAEPESFFSLSKGSAQRLSNGNTLIASSDQGRAFEITPAGETVWEYVLPYTDDDGNRAALVRMRRIAPGEIEKLGIE